MDDFEFYDDPYDDFDYDDDEIEEMERDYDPYYNDDEYSYVRSTDYPDPTRFERIVWWVCHLGWRQRHWFYRNVTERLRHCPDCHKTLHDCKCIPF